MTTTYATLHTNKGDIRIQLFPDHAPKTVRNFVGLADGSQEWSDPRSGEKKNTPLYDGVVFHRVIPGFMIQGGDPLGTGTGGPGYRFGDEFHGDLAFDRPYLLAMANAGPGTNGSQFFVTVAATPWLNMKHTIFGLMGAYVVVGRRMQADITQVVGLIAINVVIGFVAGGIDWRAHLGGLVTGALLAAHGTIDPGLLPLFTVLAMAAFLPVSEIAQIGRINLFP